MNFDDYEALWRAQPAPAAPLPSASSECAAIIDRVRDEARRFDRTIFWRDTREIVVSFAIAVHLSFSAWRATDATHIAWGELFAVALILGVAIILLIDRRNSPRQPGVEAPILDQINGAIAGVDHQIRILTRVRWNYALPISLAIIASAADSIIRQHGRSGLLSPSGVAIVGFSFLIGWFVVWLNRLAIRRVLQPKIEELEKLRNELMPIAS